ncbi:MAG: AAA family ATPase [Solirubrobacterales bacterium]|nr:AAA family ATPase [Solirubrobacterales bacterium]
MAAPGAVRVLDRELETAHLRRAMDHSWHGVGRLVVIEGPAGIGKTTLIEVARDLARRQGMQVRVARGAQLEQSFPFGVVRQLFEPLLATADEARRGEWLGGAAELAEPLFDVRAAISVPTEGSIYPRLHGLYWLCANLARDRPLALLVDDIQWADEPSLAVLEFLARRLTELAILLVLTLRPVDLDASPSLVALRAEPTARVIEPRGLSPEAVKRMLSLGFDSEVETQFASACGKATAGNPFLLVELLLELQERRVLPVGSNAGQVQTLGPRRVAEAVLSRLARSSPVAPSLATAVAILGDGASLPDAAELAGLDEQSAIEAARAIRASDLFSQEHRLRFAHPIIRAAIYESLLPAERTLRHKQAASLLYGRKAPAERVASQLLLADDLDEPWGVDQLRLAADASMAMGAPGNAVAYLRSALTVDHPDDERAALLARLGEAEVLAGLREASDHLENAVMLTPDPDDRARIALTLAQLWKYTGRVPRAVELLANLPPVRDQMLGGRIETEMLSGALMSSTGHDLLASRISLLEDPGVQARSGRERIQLILLAFERLNSNRPRAELLDLIARATVGPAAGEEGVLLPPGLMTATAVLSYIDEFERAQTICDSVITRARRRGALVALLVGLSVRGQVGYRRGGLGDALADAEASLQLAYQFAVADTPLRLHPLAIINFVAVEQERSRRELEDLLERTDRSLHPETLHGSLTLLSRARLLSALGRAEAALEQLLELGRLPSTYGTTTPACLAWRSDAALITHQLGNQQEAHRLAEKELELARAMGAARAIGIALRAVALVQKAPDVGFLSQAVRVLERSRAKLEHARALVDLGAAMRRAGERSAAREPLRQGHERAVACGATKLADLARTEIAATGARLATEGLSGAAALTPSERRVADLAAQGSSNREIAQTLFVTEKTVETHLGHIYDKLDVRSRHKLSDVLAGAAAGPPRSSPA